MVRPEYALTPAVRAALPELPWHLPAQRLGLGEESAAYRLGDVVVRVGPVWRTDAEILWFGELAATARTFVPEAIAPLRAPVRVGGHPVTVWPFVEGEPTRRGNPQSRAQAARILAGIHAALATAPGTRVTAMTQADAADLHDPELDAWIAEFDRAGGRVQALHGDFWPGNSLTSADGRIVAVLDWDDAWVQRRERELAHAAWEWGDGLDTGSLDGVREFLAAYGEHGLDEVALRQLIRERLRFEIRYARSRPEVLDDDDLVYHADQAAAFHALRPS
ncbi:Ser/Thr protein kinase RdoA (MazF antagonist) [Allocatelliglobosispora scoriae]|uniref:Ser/Thr protein kinase RdoA (MazF antagonist) n=1 Tax=Allocatelliglobosispora scoriae TaxID=643052 RepID=A0A841BK59_9ACTN|nr:aminoglycoside phosphotransferase family protein [Allocatelliglobosispora scoriae]MBB5867200.1 Ser/Thr protein kinase RdoA (MazF antagonist) [Allocatelliglobosispora scoriae]